MKIYFYCRDNADAYQDDIVVLADGLRELGHEVYGNCNYWRRSTAPDDWLVRHDPAIAPQACEIVVVSYGWPRWIDGEFRVHESPLPAGLFAPGRRFRTAYLDLEDGYYSAGFLPEFRAFDVVFRAKFNARCFHPANHEPWALGLTRRILDYTAGALPWSERTPDLLVNFNASHPYIHPARALMERRFVPPATRRFAINRERDDLTTPPADPHDRLMWAQTQRRHSRSYYDRLKRSHAVAAFCGTLIPPAPFRPPYLVGGRRAKLQHALYRALAIVDRRPPRLIQWDSWRFWEALAAGCVVFNFDLPHFGIRLPAMPENFVHYIGVRLDNVEECLRRLDQNPHLAAEIARNGREWALAHYSPRALAARFITRMSSSA